MTDRELPANAIMIPPQAELVFRGTIFEVYHWQQEMFDGSYETFEMLRRPDTIIVVAVNDDGSIVSLNEEQPNGVVRVNSLPCGRVDATDRSTLDAAKRELKEETGMEFADWQLIEVNQPEPKIEWFIHVFLARNKVSQGEPKIDPGEKIVVGSSDFETVRRGRAADVALFRQVSSLDELLEKVKEIHL